jgi:hypothetical protein
VALVKKGCFKEGQCSGHKRALEKSQSHQVLEKQLERYLNGELSLLHSFESLYQRCTGCIRFRTSWAAATREDRDLLDDCSRRANECGIILERLGAKVCR